MTVYSPGKDMVVPLFKPIIGNDGTEIREIIVPKGTNITIAMLGANTNPDIWGDDAYEWKPERWLSPLADSVAKAHFPGIYSNMSVSVTAALRLLSHLRIRMTFSGGGRACM
jgi:cytochrome P450